MHPFRLVLLLSSFTPLDISASSHSYPFPGMSLSCLTHTPSCYKRCFTLSCHQCVDCRFTAVAWSSPQHTPTSFCTLLLCSLPLLSCCFCCNAALFHCRTASCRCCFALLLLLLHCRFLRTYAHVLLHSCCTVSVKLLSYTASADNYATILRLCCFSAVAISPIKLADSSTD